MAKKADFSKKILNFLSNKQAVNIPDLKEEITSKKALKVAPTETYAITRSIKNLADLGLIETRQSDRNDYARITQKGRQKLASLKLDNKNTLANPAWDGRWRIVLLDLPEDRKAEREALRYLLKKAGFIRLKNSAYVSPYPFEFLFQNMKRDFGLTTELMIVITDSLDPETESMLKNSYKFK